MMPHALLGHHMVTLNRQELEKSYCIVQTHRQIMAFFYGTYLLSLVLIRSLMSIKTKETKTTIFALLFAIPQNIFSQGQLRFTQCFTPWI